MRGPPSERQARLVGTGVLCLLVAAFLVLARFSFLPTLSDDGLYAHQAQRVLDGRWPYRDFFLAHPPLHVLLTAAVFALTGQHTLATAKWIVVTFAALQGAAAYLTVARLGREPAAQTRLLGSPAGRQALAVAAAASLLFSQGFLILSAGDTGVVQGCGLLALAATLLAFDHPLAAGIVAGLAPLGALQTVPVLAVLGGAALLDRRARPLAVGAGLTLLLGHGLCAAAGGRAFVEQAYLFHAAKLVQPGEARDRAASVLFDSWPLLTGGVLAPLLAARRRPRDRVTGASLLAAAAAVAPFIAVFPLRRVFAVYLLPSFFPAAVGLALGAGGVVDLLRQGRSRRPWVQPAQALALAAVVLMAGDSVRRATAPLQSKPELVLSAYQWTDAPGLGRLNGLLRRWFWQGGIRRPGHTAGPVTELLWSSSRWLDSYPALVAAVRREKERHPGVSLFGDALAVPAVALAAQVPVTGDFIDTNKQRFEARQASFADVRRLLDASPSALVLLRTHDFGADTRVEAQEYFRRHYREIAAFETHTGQRHRLLAREVVSPTSAPPP